MAKLSPTSRFWLLTAAAALVAAVTFSLGQWQLRRADQKNALQEAIVAQSNQTVLQAQDLTVEKNIKNVVHRRAVLTGVWRADHTVFLDNRQMSGKPGFIAVTPLVMEQTGQVILVQRGWVPRSFVSRTELPVIQTLAGTVLVSGRIAPPPSKLYAFEGAETGRIRQNIDVTEFGRETALALIGVSLVQTGPASEGLLRDWAAPNTGVQKHYGYAFQWFALCALVIGLYVWFQVVVPWRLKQKKHSGHASSSDV